MDQTEIRFVQTAFIKERGAEVKKNPPHPPSYESPSKIPRHLVQLLAISKRIANGSHSSVCGLLFPKYSCWPRRYEQIANLLPMSQCTFSAQNVAILWRQWCNEHSAILAMVLWTPTQYCKWSNELLLLLLQPLKSQQTKMPPIPSGYAITLIQLLKNLKKGLCNRAVRCGAMNFHSRNWQFVSK